MSIGDMEVRRGRAGAERTGREALTIEPNRSWLGLPGLKSEGANREECAGGVAGSITLVREGFTGKTKS
jgi:hypothetical protein